ncbi:hypothetical protein CBS470a_005427 [Colletotrichum nupharicola]|nr:hypothetical protein CBS470a_005427 [Colletotrichum nupharicola]
MPDLYGDAECDDVIETIAQASVGGASKRDFRAELRTDIDDSKLRVSQRPHMIDASKNGPAIASDEYTVGWVCALPLEMAAAKGMLDQIHPDLHQQDPADHNNYILGQIQGHNIVIACLPAGIYGTITAATVAKDLLRTFKSIRFGLLVGIGGGVPSRTNDIRLGDIVVGQPSGTVGGAIQYDRDSRPMLKPCSKILETHPLNLPAVNEARYDSADVQDSPRCESGTRVRVQETIHNWANDEFGEPFFWLVGPAGTGKSTVARTIGDVWTKQKRLAAGYFFKRGEKGRNGTRRLFATIAVQLADSIPCFQEHLQRSIGDIDRDAIGERGLETQFDKLITSPLKALVSVDMSQQPMVIIVDALDECERPEHLSRVMTLLDKLRDIRTVRLRVLFTSRSAPEVNAAFEPFIDHKHARILELHSFFEDTKIDIQTFLSVRFAEIKLRRMVQQNPWPTEEDLDHMVRLATTPEPLFVYAATLCRFVYDEKRPSNPKKQLKLWLKQCQESKSQLHQIYDPILSQIFLSNEEADFSEQLQFLGALILLATPLPIVSLTNLLGMDGDDVNCSDLARL